jgi:transposase InsO family protein
VTVDQLVADGTPKLEAYAAVAKELGDSVSTIRSWIRLVKGVHQGDWLPRLAPAWTGRTAYAEYDPKVYQMYRDLFLHPSQPPASVCYERVQRIAAKEGLKVPSHATLRRELERREDPFVVVLEREGERRAAELYPYIERSRAGFHAMEALNADGHKLDIDTVWPDGERCRAMLITFQDLYSGKIVGWRLAKAESAHEMGLGFLEVCDRLGVCEMLWVDNTLAMASKRMTAGAKGRHRFTDKEGDPLGVLPLLGVQVRFTTPGHVQSKPIERAFGDLANHVAKHPAFTGAYLGRSTQHKPSNYGERTVTVAEVEKVVREEVLAHNARLGRRTEVCAGKLSFDSAFEASYRAHQAEIRRITPAQRRLLYLVADVVKVQPDGCVKAFGNRYWTEELVALRGRQVVLRYHPTERTLHDAVYVYGLRGEFIAEVPCYHKAGFADAEAAQAHNRARRQVVRQKKELAKATRRLAAAEVAALVPPIEAPESAADDTSVVRVDFTIPSTIDRMQTVRRPAMARDQAQEVVAATLANARDLMDAELRNAARLAG